MPTPGTPTPTAPESGPRLGFFARLEGEGDAAAAYADGLRIFEAAEEFGYATGWVAQHHFGSHRGSVPAPLVFLAAAGQRTSQLRLGTAVITLPTESPVRVAEDAAVLDALTGGRVELGVGSGSEPETFEALGADFAARREEFAERIGELRSALAGEPLPGGAVLSPPRPELTGRLWQAAMSVSGARRAGAQGTGLLLARNAPDSDRPPGERQLDLVRAYREAWRPLGGGTPRIGVSRTVHVSSDTATARAELLDGLRPYLRQRRAEDPAAEEIRPERVLVQDGVVYGDAERVAELLAADPTVGLADELLVQAFPARLAPDRLIESLRLLATEVAPALGWRRPGTAGATTR
ncbi:LLM class flavin-dependent oxidoreductase [Actinoalloteichus caeruleus]|uniref:LLM class flavin-dependent oxidoreductase n=1 Tax=Actinoalloteichus cyanogriseus TaxID=2893586 RepID=UPI003AAFD80B